MTKKPLEKTVDAVRQGQPRAIGRALTRIENDGPDTGPLVDALYPFTGQAWRIGVTGPPGAGKSSLANRLIEAYRARGRTVAVLAVDPTSPFSGGALLGDRVRMDRYYDDTGVFIRSLASRGTRGGLNRQADAMADVLDAGGFDIVLIETVGVGQGEIEVTYAVDSTVVVLVPESGDVVQAMKAGLMEIADIFCINKADHPEAGRLVEAVRSALELSSRKDDTPWQPPIVQTVATGDEEITTLVEALDDHFEYLKTSSTWETRRKDRLRRRVRSIVTTAWQQKFWTPEREAKLKRALETIDGRQQSPHALARELLDM